MTGIQKAKDLAKTILRKRRIEEEPTFWPLLTTTATAVTTGWSTSYTGLTSYCPKCKHCEDERKKS